MGIDRADDVEPIQEEPEVDLCAQTVKELVEHPLFDGVIFFTICVNAVTMVGAFASLGIRSLVFVCGASVSSDGVPNVLQAVVGPEPEPGSPGDDITFW